MQGLEVHRIIYDIVGGVLNNTNDVSLSQQWVDNF